MKKLIVLLNILLLLTLAASGWATTISIVDGTEAQITSDDFAVEGIQTDVTPPGQSFKIFESNNPSDSASIVLGLLYDELSGFGVLSARTLIFGFSTNQEASDNIITINSLTMNFGGLGTYNLNGDDTVKVTDFNGGNSEAEALFTVNLGFDFMSTFNTLTTTTLTTSLNFTNQNDGKERMFLMTNLTKEANVVPEPSTVFLLGAGLIALAAYGRKRMKK